MTEVVESYYSRHRALLQLQGREYHYKHREEHLRYSREYYLKNKEILAAKKRAKRAAAKIGAPPRLRAHLEKPNKTPELETRRQAFDEISITPIEPPKQTIFWTPSSKDFMVSFD